MEVAPLRAIYWIYETSIISMKLLVTIIDVFPATIIIIPANPHHRPTRLHLSPGAVKQPYRADPNIL